MTSEPQPSEQKPKLFQAIGILPGKVRFDSQSNRAFVQVQGKEYPLKYAPHQKGMRAWDALKLELGETGTKELRLTVYPQVLHFPGRDKTHILGFSLVGFAPINGEDNSSDKDVFTAQDFEFKLCGLWQFIPVCRTPCISIFRNFNEETKARIKPLDSGRKLRFMKVQHLPLIWKDALVPPFRFNPKLQKEEQGKRYFVEIKARFIPGRDIFGFESLNGIPTSEIPPHFKPGKALKAEVLELKKQQKRAKAQEASNINEVGSSPPTVTDKPKPALKKKVVVQPTT
ncbi:hypothetical protein NIES2119_25730 [[Phormidium ambiguum] IAM M-71]|uniref:Uncharacterized protein n=1 Tax=[Phormidium ambiguum] IAM M-71 TaxID=454136 RepID=A0A1U7I827_9CYAN|nr:hypothetical protein [Phormidium ambiguum]OKH32543.1 hypothetical protein NIES2119_25730 [Phormidium ambiguum IAM M-71]